VERRFPDQDSVDRRQSLQPRRRVHDVAGHDPLAELGPRPDGDQRFAGLHSHPHPELPAQLSDLVTDRERGSYRSLGVVLPRHGCSEYRHHRVADELLDCSPVPLQHFPETRLIGLEHPANLLHVKPLRSAREADQIREEHRHDLALLALLDRRHERRRATHTEPRSVRVLNAATRAREHERDRSAVRPGFLPVRLTRRASAARAATNR